MKKLRYNDAEFIQLLLKYYNGPIPRSHAVCKFYLQAGTFSYELHDNNEICFTRRSLVYRSQVFYWGGESSNRAIIKDIKQKAVEILPNN